MSKEEILNSQNHGFSGGQKMAALKAMQEYSDQQSREVRDKAIQECIDIIKKSSYNDFTETYCNSLIEKLKG